MPFPPELLLVTACCRWPPSPEREAAVRDAAAARIDWELFPRVVARHRVEGLVHDGLRREIHEETGLDIEPDALTGVYKNMPRGIIALVFRCKITGGQLTTNDEVTGFHWADQDDIQQLTSEAYAVRLLDALRQDVAPAIRQHDGTELLG